MNVIVRDHNGNTLDAEYLETLDDRRVGGIEAHLTDSGNIMVTLSLFSEEFPDKYPGWLGA